MIRRTLLTVAALTGCAATPQSMQPAARAPQSPTYWEMHAELNREVMRDLVQEYADRRARRNITGGMQ